MRSRPGLALLGLALSLLLASCAADPRGTAVASQPFSDAVSLTRLASDTFLAADRIAGEVRQVRVEGEDLEVLDAIARVDVRADGQRGLLGLATDGSSIWGAWTDADGLLVVGRLVPDPTTLVWRGPQSAERANGGHIVHYAGSLYVGIGDLEDPERVADPEAPNGKILRLDPAAGPDQHPDVVSSGWNNPFAFTFDETGLLVVADNSAGDAPERLVVESEQNSTSADLPPDTAPSGLAVHDRRILVCGYVSGELQEWSFDVDSGGSGLEPGRVVADDCRLSVAWVTSDLTLYSTGEELRLVRLPAP